MHGLTQNSNRRSPAGICAAVLVLWLIIGTTCLAQSLETRDMKAPGRMQGSTAPASGAETSPSILSSALLGSVKFFQKWLSPIDGPRCSFSPTCSQFGYDAVHQHGPFKGVVMTADRLMRCSYWTSPNADYIGLPNGALHDPVEKTSRASNE